MKPPRIFSVHLVRTSTAMRIALEVARELEQEKERKKEKATNEPPRGSSRAQ